MTREPQETAATMTELEKLDAGLEYCFDDAEVAARKQAALIACRELDAIDPREAEARDTALRALLGSCGEVIDVQPGFRCDHGANIHVGESFLANYDVTILDIAPVRIGDHCMIGPGTVISTVGHPLSAAGRRAHLGLGEPVTLGDDVWIGAHCTILPGVTIGSDVVIAAGAVVTKDVPDHCVVGGVPATVLTHLDPSA